MDWTTLGKSELECWFGTIFTSIIIICFMIKQTMKQIYNIEEEKAKDW